MEGNPIVSFQEALNQLYSGKLSNTLNRDELIFSKNLYHFTDIKNAVSILHSGAIYSRKYCIEHGLMINDNASQEVISGTHSNVIDYVRLYFRPKTPTQFRNEGIMNKEELAKSEYRAHCPIPIFFLFDSFEIFSNPNFCFSSISLAKHGNVEISNRVQDFLNLPFDDIYHNKSLYNEPRKQEIISRRHAEVVINQKMELTSLKYIVVRSIAEKEYLLFLLGAERSKYSEYIKIDNKKLFFYGNRAYLIGVILNKNNVSFSFNYGNNIDKFDVRIEFSDMEKGLFYWEQKNIKLKEVPPLAIPDLKNYNIFIYLDGIQIYANSFVYEDNNVPF